MDELCFLSASALARLIGARAASSVEVVGACLERMQAVNPRLNAVVQLAPDALEQAYAADEALAHGELRGPLHGVPFTIKDTIETAGLVTTGGTLGRRGHVPRICRGGW